MKKELAHLLEAGQDRTARIREAVTSVIFAAPRCSDIPELVDAKKNFTAKYGKEFVSAAIELRPDCGVSRMLVEKLSAVAPDVQTKVKVLSAVAKEHSINWDPTSFEEKESKPPDDLLKFHEDFKTLDSSFSLLGSRSNTEFSMDKLPHSLLLQILSRLDDSADVARCRVASKAFSTVFPGLRSINLKWHINSRSTVKPFQAVFLDLISKLETVESVCIGLGNPIDLESDDDFYLTDGDFAKVWLPRVSGSLKSLSISDDHDQRQSNILPLISVYCHDLVNLKLKCAWLSVHNLNPMPMLTSLTLAFIRLEDANLNELNKCFPNLQVLNLVGVIGLKDPKIHLLNLKTCLWAVYTFLPSLTLITPNLVTLKLECTRPTALRVEAPMLSHFHLHLTGLNHIGVLLKKFENLKTFWLESFHIGSLLSEFPIIKTVENLTVDSRNKAPGDARHSKLTLRKVFSVFPNVSSLCIKSSAWSDIQTSMDLGGLEILDGRKGLKTICIYLTLVDPLLTFAYVACLLDQCVGLSDVSLLILGKDFGPESESFMPCKDFGPEYESFTSKCMVCWPRLKWRWGLWSEHWEDYWIADGISI
ncbi:hypothetical protein L1987_53990 [Smallanthus sonchifolius]|uniref:Uncharacterized protein n=1 Tax=Smallanthus sonchifolius TaxID=185202 RepID=A0ACB9E6Y9_9ASTR|nr:hypothetical protein L1987_53990 [Smallanthus sonchifolius]